MWYVNNFFQLECLQAHNRFRAIHGYSPLKLNKHLTDFTSNLAQKLDELNTQKDSNVRAFGVNSVFMTESMEINGEAPARFQYRKERKSYNWQEPKYYESSSSSSFTKIVWKESSHLGVGGCMMGDVSIVVTQYSPSNNVQGTFERNVPPRIFEETLQQRCARLVHQQKMQQQRQQQRRYYEKLREYYKQQRLLEQQQLQDEQRKQQEQQKHKQKLQPTSLDVLTKTLDYSPQLTYMGIALIIATTLAAYGAYSYMH